MATKGSFDIGKFKRKLEKTFNVDVIEDIIEAIYLGATDIIKAAKNNDTYKDQTNQLRSSLGFVLYHNGQKVRQYFEATSRNAEGTGGDVGVQKGLATAEAVAQQHNEGICCVLVAGANYALAVEAKGYDVMTSHTNHAKDFIEPYLKQIEQGLQELMDNGEL
jgi:hypothetical protein